MENNQENTSKKNVNDRKILRRLSSRSNESIDNSNPPSNSYISSLFTPNPSTFSSSTLQTRYDRGQSNQSLNEKNSDDGSEREMFDYNRERYEEEEHMLKDLNNSDILNDPKSTQILTSIELSSRIEFEGDNEGEGRNLSPNPTAERLDQQFSTSLSISSSYTGRESSSRRKRSHSLGSDILPDVSSFTDKLRSFVRKGSTSISVNSTGNPDQDIENPTEKGQEDPKMNDPVLSTGNYSSNPRNFKGSGQSVDGIELINTENNKETPFDHSGNSTKMDTVNEKLRATSSVSNDNFIPLDFSKKEPGSMNRTDSNDPQATYDRNNISDYNSEHGVFTFNKNTSTERAGWLHQFKEFTLDGSHVCSETKYYRLKDLYHYISIHAIQNLGTENDLQRKPHKDNVFGNYIPELKIKEEKEGIDKSQPNVARKLNSGENTKISSRHSTVQCSNGESNESNSTGKPPENHVSSKKDLNMKDSNSSESDTSSSGDMKSTVRSMSPETLIDNADFTSKSQRLEHIRFNITKEEQMMRSSQSFGRRHSMPATTSMKDLSKIFQQEQEAYTNMHSNNIIQTPLSKPNDNIPKSIRQISKKEVYNIDQMKANSIKFHPPPFNYNTDSTSFSAMNPFLRANLKAVNTTSLPGVGYLQPHDLRKLTDIVPTQLNEPAITVRRHVILLNFDGYTPEMNVRAIVLFDRVLLYVPKGSDSLLYQFERRLNEALEDYHHSNFGSDGSSVNQSYVEKTDYYTNNFEKGLVKNNNLYAYGTKPFELVAVESVLSTVCYLTDLKIKKTTIPMKVLITKLSSQKGSTSTQAQDQLRAFKNLVNTEKTRVRNIRRAVHSLLEEDEDIDAMCLTTLRHLTYNLKMMNKKYQKWEEEESPRQTRNRTNSSEGNRQNENPSGQNVPTDTTGESGIGQPVHKDTSEISSHFSLNSYPHDTDIDNLAPPINHVSMSQFKEEREQMEILLESYFQDIVSDANTLEILANDIENTEQLVLLRLDTARNRLLTVTTVFTFFNFFVACSTYIAGLFGMNLDNGLFPTESETTKYFKQVCWISGLGVIAFTIIIMWRLRASGILTI